MIKIKLGRFVETELSEGDITSVILRQVALVAHQQWMEIADVMMVLENDEWEYLFDDTVDEIVFWNDDLASVEEVKEALDDLGIAYDDPEDISTVWVDTEFFDTVDDEGYETEEVFDTIELDDEEDDTELEDLLDEEETDGGEERVEEVVWLSDCWGDVD